MYVNIVDIFLLILDDVDHFTTSENDQQFMSEKFHRLLRTADDHDIKVKSYIGIIQITQYPAVYTLSAGTPQSLTKHPGWAMNRGTLSKVSNTNPNKPGDCML